MEKRWPLLPTLFGVIALVTWSFSGTLVKLILEKVPLLVLLAVAYFISGTLLVLIYRAGAKCWGEIFGRSPARLTALVILFVAMSLGYVGAIALVQERSQVPALLAINYSWPMLAVVIGIPVLGLRPRWLWLGSGLALALSGLFLVIVHSSGADNALPPVAATAAMLGSNLAWGLFSAFSRRFRPHLPTGAHVGIHHLAVAFSAGTLALACHKEPVSLDGETAGLIALYAVCVLALGYWGWDYGMRKGRFEILAAASYLVPVFAITSAMIFLAVPVPGPVWVALSLFIAAAWCCRHGIIDSTLPQPAPIRSLGLPGARGKR